MPPNTASRPRRPPEERLGANQPNPQNEDGQAQAEKKAQLPPASPKNTCSNPDCSYPKPVEIDGERVCETCGSIISENNIVAEVTFGENSAGAAVVQGGYIGEGQRHAKTLGAAVNRKVGGGLTSREQTHQHFQQEIARIASSIGLQQSVKDGAFNFMKLALINNFTYGRSTATVAAVSLYLACRTDRENNTLLMDLAEAVKTNVYKLGKTYQELAKMLYMDGGVKKDDVTPFVEIERLILKYARRLEFGVHTYKVAEDAAKIIKRMKRDWMVTGRRPAGLCGAGLILAARMNNFRRTVREVVYVVKVADMTIAKRLDEFDRTTSGGLTVEQFRQYGANLKIAHDPPVYHDNKVKAELARTRQDRKRTRSLLAERESGELGTPSVWDKALLGRASNRSTTPASSRPPTSTQAPSHEPRRDAEGFAIPALPIDPRLTNDSAQSSSATGRATTSQPSSQARKRSHQDMSQNTQDLELTDLNPTRKRRKRKPADRPAPICITAADLASEAELENEINRHLHSADCISSMESVQFAKYAENASRLARTLLNKPEHNSSPTSSASIVTPPASFNPDTTSSSSNPDPSSSSSNSTTAATSTSTSNHVHPSPIPESETISESEFASDPEVMHCLLSEAEIAIKERIWVTHNEDWLRAQQARLLRRALASAGGTAGSGSRSGGGGGGTRRKRTFRRGDGSSRMDGEGAPARSPAEASARMLQRYGQKGFSKHINYERLNQIYRGKEGDGGSESGSGSGRGSGSGSASRSQSHSQSTRGSAAPPSAGAVLRAQSGEPEGDKGDETEEITSEAGSRGSLRVASSEGSVVEVESSGEPINRPRPLSVEEMQAREGVREVMVISDDEEIDDDLDDLEQYLEEEDVESVVQEAGMGMGGDIDDLSQYADNYDE
ncbi:MAG: transcription factor TFIIIB subunit brf1 [Bathelium mastoideum]|nr:MAG: transcription factor TFIIIB subunit brf1 [Bathelium mastoideum]